jgi:molybdate transport system substrate-binding protein
MNRLLALFLALIPLSVAFAAELRVLSAGAVEPGLRAFAEATRRDTGHLLSIQFNTAPQIAKRLDAGEAFDILIAPPAVITQAEKDARVAPGTRVPVGRVGAGVVVRSAADAPNVATVDALKQALLAADSIVYNTASTGIYLDRLFDKLGVRDAIGPKTTRYPDGASVMEHVIRGSGRVIGFGAITEIRMYEPKGLRLVGPLPADVQNYTAYEAALMSAAKSPDAAREVLNRIASPAGRSAFASGGLD